jgi:NADH-quinone oxidoreductase subunit C
MTDQNDAQQTAPAPITLHGAPLVESFGQSVVFVARERYSALMKALLADGYEMCVDLTAVDYLLLPNRVLPAGVVDAGITAERFEVVVNLLSMRDRKRLRVRVQLSESDLTMPTLFDQHPGSEAMEREAYDMFGIEFIDHPDLTRILMPEDWDGHPLRKDYDVGRIPVQFTTGTLPTSAPR